jgi:heme exporter protein D
MKAVNLVPGDSRRGQGGFGAPAIGPGFAVLVLLAVAVAYVTLYVVTTNSISDHKAQLAEVNAQIDQQKALASRLANYASFQKLARAQADSVRTIARARFDWDGALQNVARVFPASTSLSALFASATNTSSVSGASGSAVGGSAASVRATSAGPAFELSGCTKTQEDVAGLISRLRVVPGVTGVTLGDSVKHVTADGPSSNAPSCGGGPDFDLVVFFKAPPGSVAAAAVSTGAPGATTSTPNSTTATTGATTSTTSATTSTTSATPPPSP